MCHVAQPAHVSLSCGRGVECLPIPICPLSEAILRFCWVQFAGRESDAAWRKIGGGSKTESDRSHRIYTVQKPKDISRLQSSAKHLISSLFDFIQSPLSVNCETSDTTHVFMLTRYRCSAQTR